MRKLLRDTNLQLMFGVTFMVILGVSSVSPALPRVMDELGVPAQSIGLVITAFTLPGIFLAPLIGILADRVGRKKILVASLFVFGIFGTACGFAQSLESLLLFRFLQGVGVGPIGVLNATIIGDLYDGEERHAAMGYLGIFISFGTAMFPVIGGFLAVPGWRYPFLMPIIAIPLAVLVLLYLDNPEPKNKQTLGDYARSTYAVLRARKVAGLFLITLLTNIILYGCFVTFLPVLLRDKFISSTAMIGVLMAVSSLATALCSSQLSILTHWFKETYVLQTSFCLFFLGMAVIPLLPNLWAFVIPTALVGAAMGLSAPLRISILTGLAPIENRAGLMAVNAIMLRLGQTIAPVAMGIVLAAFSIDAVYLVGAVVAIVMIFLTWWLVR